jgi:hypothetical protein
VEHRYRFGGVVGSGFDLGKREVGIVGKEMMMMRMTVMMMIAEMGCLDLWNLSYQVHWL